MESHQICHIEYSYGIAQCCTCYWSLHVRKEHNALWEIHGPLNVHNSNKVVTWQTSLTRIVRGVNLFLETANHIIGTDGKLIIYVCIWCGHYLHREIQQLLVWVGQSCSVRNAFQVSVVLFRLNWKYLSMLDIF
jgi:hypothetical protein